MRHALLRRRAEPDQPAVRAVPADLTGFFTPPRWLRDLGRSAWLAVGVTLLVVALVWLLSLTDVIVMPVVAACVMGAVAAPVVAALERRRVPRAVGALLLLLAAVLLGVGVAVMVVAGVSSQLDDVSVRLAAARDTLTGWLADAGVDAGAADAAGQDVSQGLSDAVPALLHGIGAGLTALSSVVVFFAFTALSLLFVLKDGPLIRRWAERATGLPEGVAHQMGDRVLASLRGYFGGVTIIAAYNAAVVVVGAAIVGVPLLGAIAVITFLAAYVPYLGAWGAGAFVVLIALGAEGPEAAAAMIVVQLLANGVLQQLVQPFAYGVALGIHPLAVLIVTIAGGALFGAVGLILAAPMTAAATRVAADLSGSRTSPSAGGSPAPAGVESADGHRGVDVGGGP
ncbi:MAG TPA: AI-2E family transporter [Capillimicrobium sp.]|nr:AI-2E family transporter [Capillimicrobium sp.]